jgi:hypothetical protein
LKYSSTAAAIGLAEPEICRLTALLKGGAC